ncbi:hypothetical protein [Kitasatospora sp. NPDC050543]|uniref:LppU/SCO3897 family protein n=1 Tax=Kitasatospora sp. NPDC050543 TaxID=3364054 RepID=UPI0037957981
MSTPPPQMPYGAPPAGDNPYATGNPYGAAPAVPPPAPGGYGYPAAPAPVPMPGQQPGMYEQPYQAPGYAYGAPQGPVCRFCGGFPAVNATVRGHQGMIIIMRFLKQPGPFCRTCGTATVRDMSARTMVQGWWGYLSLLITPITLLINLSANGSIKRLPPPVPGQHGPQLDPGVPLTKRPHMLGLLIPVAAVSSFVILMIVGALAGSSSHSSTPYRVPPTITVPSIPAPTFPTIPSFPTGAPLDTGAATAPPKASPSKVNPDVDRAKVGDCLRNEHETTATDDKSPEIKMLPCTDPKAEYKVLAKVLGTSDSEKACAPYPTADSSYYVENGARSYVLCLGPVTKGSAS